MQNIIDGEIRSAQATGTCSREDRTGTLEDRTKFILQRKRDALNCYLRTCCMRLADDIILEEEEEEEDTTDCHGIDAADREEPASAAGCSESLGLPYV